MTDKKAMILLADGFEEVEALSVVDCLRRADITIDLVAVSNRDWVLSSHQVKIAADRHLAEVGPGTEYQAVITPGGLPGARTLQSDPAVQQLLAHFDQQGKIVAAICASPIALETAGVAGRHSGTIFPSMEEQVRYQTFSQDLVVRDGNLITSRGPATAFLFGLELVRQLAGEAAWAKVRRALLIPQLQEQIAQY
ncbi:MAG: DJ-1/PfpI family protein [Oscillospiraceae bacterium]|nr:DJ-1/PfpI family protein [Oscillospiraceae bacterium]